MITWVSAATPSYASDLSRLVASGRLLGAGQKLVVTITDTPWQHIQKFKLLQQQLDIITTPYIAWIDADCEWQCPLTVEEVMGDKPLMTVRHFCQGPMAAYLPQRFMSRVTWESAGLCYQACLFGGKVEAVRTLLADMAWMEKAGETYDEYGLTIYWDQHRDNVRVLPTNYATPANWHLWPEFNRSSYNERSNGPTPKILHHNRASYPI